LWIGLNYHISEYDDMSVGTIKIGKLLTTLVAVIWSGWPPARGLVTHVEPGVCL